MSREKGHDEVFCASCGKAIKKQAEICPHCGVRTKEGNKAPSSSPSKRRSNSRISNSSPTTDYDISVLVEYGSLALQWFFGISLILAGFGAFLSGGDFLGFIAAILQGSILIVIGSVLIPPIRDKISMEHSVSTFGWTRSVSQEVIENTGEPCSACYDSINKGVARTYQEQFVLFGVPLFVSEEGRNTYCRTCAGGEPSVNTGELKINTT